MTQKAIDGKVTCLLLKEENPEEVGDAVEKWKKTLTMNEIELLNKLREIAIEKQGGVTD